jgi:hypothetical protein
MRRIILVKTYRFYRKVLGKIAYLFERGPTMHLLFFLGDSELSLMILFLLALCSTLPDPAPSNVLSKEAAISYYDTWTAELDRLTAAQVEGRHFLRETEKQVKAIEDSRNQKGLRSLKRVKDAGSVIGASLGLGASVGVQSLIGFQFGSDLVASTLVYGGLTMGGLWAGKHLALHATKQNSNGLDQGGEHFFDLFEHEWASRFLSYEAQINEIMELVETRVWTKVIADRVNQLSTLFNKIDLVSVPEFLTWAEAGLNEQISDPKHLEFYGAHMRLNLLTKISDDFSLRVEAMTKISEALAKQYDIPSESKSPLPPSSPDADFPDPSQPSLPKISKISKCSPDIRSIADLDSARWGLYLDH